MAGIYGLQFNLSMNAVGWFLTLPFSVIKISAHLCNRLLNIYFFSLKQFFLSLKRISFTLYILMDVFACAVCVLVTERINTFLLVRETGSQCHGDQDVRIHLVCLRAQVDPRLLGLDLTTTAPTLELTKEWSMEVCLLHQLNPMVFLAAPYVMSDIRVLLFDDKVCHFIEMTFLLLFSLCTGGGNFVCLLFVVALICYVLIILYLLKSFYPWLATLSFIY